MREHEARNQKEYVHELGASFVVIGVPRWLNTIPYIHFHNILPLNQQNMYFVIQDGYNYLIIYMRMVDHISKNYMYMIFMTSNTECMLQFVL